MDFLFLILGTMLLVILVMPGWKSFGVATLVVGLLLLSLFGDRPSSEACIGSAQCGGAMGGYLGARLISVVAAGGYFITIFVKITLLVFLGNRRLSQGQNGNDRDRMNP